MQYGAQRLISPLDWANTRRTFEGGLVRAVNEDITTDVFVTRWVDAAPHEFDNPDQDRFFSGVYNTWKIAEGRGLDVYFLALHDDPGPPLQTPPPPPRGAPRGRPADGGHRHLHPGRPLLRQVGRVRLRPRGRQAERQPQRA